MRITRLRLHDVKRHRDLDLEFAPGMNVVRGPNKSGKSTIQRAIELVLFRKATSTAQELQDVRAWEDQATDPSIELDFEHDGTVGRLVKTFAGQRGAVTLELGEDSVTDPSRVERMVAELTGVPSEKFFRSTAGVRHLELADLDRDEGALRDRLQLSMSGADRGTWTAKRRLDEVIKRYRAEGPRNAGPLRAARDEISRLEADLRRGEAELQRLEQDRAALAAARAARDALDIRLRTEQEQLEEAELAVSLVARQQEAERLYERYRRAAELRAEIARLEAAHPSQTALPVLREGVDQLRGLEYDIVEYRAEASSQPEPTQRQPIASGPSATVPAIVALALLVAGATGFILIGGVAGGAVAAAFAVLGLVAGVRAFRVRRIATAIRIQNDLLEGEIARRLQGRSELDDKLRHAERDRDALLARLGVADLPAAERLMASESDHVSSIERLRAEERGLLDDAELNNSVVILRDRAASDAEQARHALAGMGDAGIEPDAARGRLVAMVRATRTRRDAALTEEGQAHGRVDNNAVDAEAVAATAERLTVVQEELATSERRLRIYQATLDGINAAELSTMKKAARFLEQRMANDVAELTDGRYRQIRVDEHNLVFEVWSPELGDWVRAAALSQGTIDQLYLAARLGLVRQVTQGRQPPLVFDDPFVTFDDDRARRALELLRRVAGDHQVIFLTCSDRYDAIVDRVIELPAPLARDERPLQLSGSPGGGDGHRPVSAPTAGPVSAHGGPSPVGGPAIATGKA